MSNNNKATPGKLVIISGPSGVGKSSVCAGLLESIPNTVLSISATSRLPRGSEEDGKEYFFYSEEKFLSLVDENMFLEFAKVHGNYYGTPKAFINEKTRLGCHCLLDIDVQGALKIFTFPEYNILSIFLLPPKLEELLSRLNNRGSDTKESIEQRMINAQGELKVAEQYQHRIVNEDLSQTIEQIKSLIEKA